jgi:hypothetical protein
MATKKGTAARAAEFTKLWHGLIQNGDDEAKAGDYESAETSYLHAYFIGKALKKSPAQLRAVRKKVLEAFVKQL